MSFTLLPLSKPQLESLAASQVPEEFLLRAEPDSLPPSFVAARSLKLSEQAPSEPWGTTFLIVRNMDSRLIGACGFKTAPNAGRVEVGYGVSPSARCTGAATAALNILTRLAFEAGASEVLAEVLPDNVASIGVVQKAGFSKIGDRVDDDGRYVVQWLYRRGT
jgi:[ribosomal protein S5]-alanine N-acetyltransferase